MEMILSNCYAYANKYFTGTRIDSIAYGRKY